MWEAVICMASELNPETGLPVLPEPDLFYRVNKLSVDIRRRYPDTEWLGYYDRVWDERDIDSREEQRVTHEPIPRKWGNFWLGGYRSVIQVRRVERSSLEARYECAVYESNLLILAEKALAIYKEKKITEALYGDYPPKKFQ